MSDSKTCSQIIRCILEMKIECGHCEAINYVREDFDADDNDPSKLDIEAVTCWSCGKTSFIDKGFLDIYPLGTEEMVETVEGKSTGSFD